MHIIIIHGIRNINIAENVININIMSNKIQKLYSLLIGFMLKLKKLPNI